MTNCVLPETPLTESVTTPAVCALEFIGDAEHWDRIADLVGTPEPDRRTRLQAMIGRLTELSEGDAERVAVKALHAVNQDALAAREAELKVLRASLEAQETELVARRLSADTQEASSRPSALRETCSGGLRRRSTTR